MSYSTIETAKMHIMNTYASFPLVFVKGEGRHLYDENGKSYLDFVAGIAVNALGYGHERYLQRVTEQLRDLVHVSNLYYNQAAPALAAKLTKYSGMDKAFFCNSGAEAVEAALKLARLYAKQHKSPDAYKIVSMLNSFHGRTFGAISATGQQKYQQGLDPLLPEVSFVEFNNLKALEAAIDDKTAAVILEPIQGEGGINPADKAYLQGVRKLCDEQDVVLIFDEVQSGIGRTGEFFAYQHYDMMPDIVTCAKGLGGGIPIGAILASEDTASAFTPGTHASTFGGNALASTAALVVVEELMEYGLLDEVRKQGLYLEEKLRDLASKQAVISSVKGKGLMLGIQVTVPPVDIVKKAMEKGLLLVGAGTDVVRFVPSLTVTMEEIDACVEILASVLEEVQ